VTSTVALLGRAEYVALTTFRADGSAVTTPVWAAERDGRLVVWTPGRSAKVRRIRRTSRVTVAVCDFSGGRCGPAVPGVARLLPRAEHASVKRALNASYGRRFRWFRLVLLLSRMRRAGGAPAAIEVAISR
jgi:PPOX class probable F420-dependent enzyme